MLRINRSLKLLWLSAAIVSLLCAIVAIIRPGVYAGFVEEKYMNGTIAQDVMAILASVALMALIPRMKGGSYFEQTAGLGLMGFLFYAYGVYVIEQIYNVLYFGYMAVFSLSFFGIVYALFRIDAPNVDSASIPLGFKRLSCVFTLVIPAVFVPLWTMMQAQLISTGEQLQNTYGVLIMDLCLIMPLFIIAAIQSLRGMKAAIVLTPALFVLGFALLFPVGFSELIPRLFLSGTGPVNLPSFLLYGGLAALFLIIGIVHMKKVRFDARRADV